MSLSTPCFGQRGDIHENRIAAPIVRDQPLVLQLLADFQRVGVRVVDLVDRHQQGHLGGARVVERLEGLGHHAVIGGDHQHDQVRHIRSARAHGTESGVAGGVEEGDLGQLILALRVRERNGVGADVLGDAAGFAGRDVGLADHVEQAGLAVVNVTHDRYHRRARDQVFRLVFHIQLHGLCGSVNQSAAALALFDLETEAVLGADSLGHFVVNSLIDVRKDARLHQIGDDLERFLFELFCQVANHDRRLDRDHLGIGWQHDLRGAACQFGGFGRRALFAGQKPWRRASRVRLARWCRREHRGYRRAG